MTAAARAKRVLPATWPAAMKQWQAAAYLGMSVTTFAARVDVPAVPVAPPRPGAKPILRYRKADLDAWLARCADWRLSREA